MELEKYPLLTSAEKIAIQEKLSIQWKTFIQTKQKEKDVRYLFLEENFWEVLSELSFSNGRWREHPLKNEHPKFLLTLINKDFNGVYLSGNWKSLLEISSFDDRFTANSDTILIFQKLIEEFGTYEYIMQMDAPNWVGKE